MCGSTLRGMTRVASSLLLCLLSLAVAADQAPRTPPDCSDPAHRQFDFWIGTWNVTRPDGKPAGKNTIRSRFDGCALEEQWESARLTGGSFSAYDRTKGKWHQTWVDSTGTVLQLHGELVDGAMVLSGEQGGARQRITWRRMEGGRVRQTWESSTDGKSWSIVFDGIYAPAR